MGEEGKKMENLLCLRIGELRRSEAREFLRLCQELRINTCVDLSWLAEKSYPMVFRGATEIGQVFTSLWEERRLVAALVVASEKSVEEVGVQESGITSVKVKSEMPRSIGYHGGFECRRTQKLPYIGRDRRRRF